MPASRKYPNELRERAQRLVAEAREQDQTLSLNAAVLRIGPRVGVNPDTLRGWCKQGDIDAGRRPASMSPCLHQPRNVSAFTPTLGPIRSTAAFNDNVWSCSRASATSRCARSRNSFGYFLGAGIEPLSRGFGASTRPGAVQAVPPRRRGTEHLGGPDDQRR